MWGSPVEYVFVKFRINFRFDQKGIENGIEEHSKLEKLSLLGHD